LNTDDAITDGLYRLVKFLLTPAGDEDVRSLFDE